jgi:hypothetical protein
MEFSSIDRATARGFRLSGSGTASVTTAPLYKAGKRYKVVLRGESGARRLSVRADGAGRLHVTVPLGRANALQQQFTLTGASPATRVRTVTVSISAP